MPDDIRLIETTADDPVALTLFAAQEAELLRRYGGDDTGPRPSPGSPTLVLERGGEPVGCVALAADGSIGEIKRMFVTEPARGHGLSRVLLGEVEALAVRRGLDTLQLVTGVEQPEAMALYASSGYVAIPGFGRWADEPSARFFAKQLEPERSAALA